jgi:glycosyltransferase involved in cell wall biosynthesis
MHVCFVSREYPPNPMGGIGTYVANMTRVLAEAGVDVSVLTQDCPQAPTHGYGNPAISCNGRLRVRYLPFVDSDWRLFPASWNTETEALSKRDAVAAFGPVVSTALEKLLLAEKIDAIEAPEYEAPLLHFQAKRAALPPDHPWRAVPTVVHLHSPSHMIFANDDDPLATPWVRARKAHEALSIELADGVIAPSAYLARQVSAWLRLEPGRVSVIPYPIGPLLRYAPDTKPVAGRCLFVGRIEPRKGVFEFVEAAVRVAKKFPQASFRFVGGPHHRDGKSGGIETARLIASRIPDDLRARFDFAGKVPREALGDEYAAAAFVAVPSRWENYPNTCMEAMSCARPVLASDQGGMPEMIEDESEGVIAPGATRRELVDNLAAGLEKMLLKSPEELAAMGEKSRARILSICDDGAITKRHTDYYARLGEKTSAKRAAAKTVPTNFALALLDDGADKKRAADACEALARQTVDVPVRILATDDPAKSVPAGWMRIEGDATGCKAGLAPLARRLDAAIGNADVIYVGAADDLLAPDAFRLAANVFTNHPECAFCAVWTVTKGNVSAAYRSDPAHLASPADFAERWFFRGHALAECGGVAANGYFLQDVLRDAVLRLIEKGWRGTMIPQPLVDVAGRGACAVLSPFAFSERRDSIRAVAEAHAAFLANDPAAGAEFLSQIVY